MSYNAVFFIIKSDRFCGLSWKYAFLHDIIHLSTN